MEYLTLFISAFISATIFPMGSEALLLYDLSLGLSPALLLGVATLGNTLGAVLNYYLARAGEAYLSQKKILTEAKLAKAKKRFDVYGGWVLLLSWMPFVGDVLTFAAGILRYHFWKFVLLVSIGKFGRYWVLYWFSL